MLNRRVFIAGACCTAHLGVFCKANASEIAKPFICSTLDSPPMSVSDIERGGGPQTITVDKGGTELDFTMLPYGTAFLKNRWLLSDGLNPGHSPITLGVSILDGSDSDKDIV